MLNAITSPATDAILAAAVAVQTEFGVGYLESAYQDALEIEFRRRGIAHDREQRLPLYYRGEQIATVYRPDFVCTGIVVELKASKSLTSADEAQLIHYLKGTGVHLGLLINFGVKPLQVRRMVHGPPPSPA